MPDPDLDDRLRELFEEDARDLEPSDRLDDLVRQLREQRIRRRRWAARGLATVAVVATVAVTSAVLRSPDRPASVVAGTSRGDDETLFLVAGGSLPEGFELLATSGGNTPGVRIGRGTGTWDRTQRWVRFDAAHEHPVEVIDIQWRASKVLRDDVRSMEEQGWVERQSGAGSERGSVVRVTGHVARGHPDGMGSPDGSEAPLPPEVLRQVLDDLTPRAPDGFALARAPDGFELVGEWSGRAEAGTNRRLVAYGESNLRGFQLEIVDDSERPLSMSLDDSTVRLVTVRGNEGIVAPHNLGSENRFDPSVLFLSDITASVMWVEPGGELVTITAAGMTEDEVLAIADDLEVVDADTWFALHGPDGVDPSGSLPSSTTVVFP